MPRLLFTDAPGDHAGEAPVHQISGEGKLQPVTFVTGNVVALSRQTLLARHGVGGLGGEKPEQLCLLIPKDVEAHLSAGHWKEDYLAPRGVELRLNNDLIAIEYRFHQAAITTSRCVCTHQNVKGISGRIVPIMVRIGNAHNVGFQPAGKLSEGAVIGIFVTMTLCREEGDAEQIQCFVVHHIAETQTIGERPVFTLGKVIGQLGAEYDRRKVGDLPAGGKFVRLDK